jgi:conjugative transposon TraN protein
MKSVVGTVLLIVMAFSLKAQTQDVQTKISGRIFPVIIEVGYDQTVNLIFPYSIKSVDRGHSEVLVQKAKGVENVLQLKAASEDFTNTNLTVITGEGAFYSFQLTYSNNPPKLNHKIAEMSLPAESVVFLSGNENEAVLFDDAKRIVAKNGFINKPADESFETSLKLQGIYIRDNTIYLQLFLSNNSHIRYDIDQFRISIKDKRITKRTAAQEIGVQPLYTEGNIKCIEGISSQVVVVAIDKLTIPDKKYLMIQLMEKNGGRHLKLKLHNRHLVKAKPI